MEKPYWYPENSTMGVVDKNLKDFNTIAPNKDNDHEIKK